MASDITQQRYVAELVEPVGVVDHYRIARAVTELDEPGEDHADARHIAGDSASSSSWRATSLPEGSPIRVVPPPISTIGLWPHFWNSRNNMMPTKLPTCRLSAVQS